MRTKSPAVDAQFPLWPREIAQGPLKYRCSRKKLLRGELFYAVRLKISVVEGQIAL